MRKTFQGDKVLSELTIPEAEVKKVMTQLNQALKNLKIDFKFVKFNKSEINGVKKLCQKQDTVECQLFAKIFKYLTTAMPLIEVSKHGVLGNMDIGTDLSKRKIYFLEPMPQDPADVLRKIMGI